MPVPESLARSLQDPTLTPETDAAVEIARPLLKHVRPLGHEIILWRQACLQLLTWMEKGRFDQGLTGFLQHWKPATAPTPEDLTDSFTLLLRGHPGGWWVTQSSFGWLNDPAWSALLHLPALRQAWAALLRSSHLEHLRQMLPQAWFLDATPLPPGSVLAGLGIPGWTSLPELARDLTLHRAGLTLSGKLPQPTWLSALQDALATQAELLTQPPPADAPCLLARYTRDEAGVHLQDAWITEASGPVSRVKGL